MVRRNKIVASRRLSDTQQYLLNTRYFSAIFVFAPMQIYFRYLSKHSKVPSFQLTPLLHPLRLRHPRPPHPLYGDTLHPPIPIPTPIPPNPRMRYNNWMACCALESSAMSGSPVDHLGIFKD